MTRTYTYRVNTVNTELTAKIHGARLSVRIVRKTEIQANYKEYLFRLIFIPYNLLVDDEEISLIFHSKL